MLLKHAMKIVERVLKRLRDIVYLDELQFGFMLGKETVDALFCIKKNGKRVSREGEKFVQVFS